MKILVVSDLYPPHFIGGYELKCKLHVDELMQRGHQVSVLTSTWKTNREDVFESNISRILYTTRSEQLSLRPRKNILISSNYIKRFNQLRRMFTSRRNYKITYQILTKDKPDLIYAWQMDDVSIGPVLAAQDLYIPIVFRLDDYWLANLKNELCSNANLLKKRYRTMINGIRDFNDIDFSHMFVVSSSVKKKYVEAGFVAKNITVVPEGVLSNTILDGSELKKPEFDIFRIVYVGRLVHQKGTHVALQALSHLVKEMGISNIHLDIIGHGPNEYKEQLENTATKLDIGFYVSFVGFMEHQQILNHFSKYNVVVIPSLWEEPLSGTIAEAMARGLPVIATDRGGNPEIIFDGENGLLVPPGDYLKLAYAIKKLIDDPDVSQKFRRNGLATVREKYVHEKIVDRIEEYFKSILNSKVSSTV